MPKKSDLLKEADYQLMKSRDILLQVHNRIDMIKRLLEEEKDGSNDEDTG